MPSTQVELPAAAPTAAQDDDLPAFVVRLMLGLGRGLMVVGVLLLLFAAFQLWGTGISEARAQATLAERFEQQLQNRVDERLEDAATVGPTDTAVTAVSADTALASAPQPDPLVVEVPDAAVEVGDPIGVLSIPAIDVEKTIAEGTTRDVLRSGPGHYPSTPLPGQRGNVAIAGHRTTHGAPFLDIDQLVPGDEITVETVDGTYTYAVEEQIDEAGNSSGHLIVRPEDIGVIMDKGDDRLTLTACHPKYSARQRIIVTAVLVSAPAPPPVIVNVAALIDQVPVEAPAIEASAVDTAPVNPVPVDRLAFEEAVGSESLGWQAGYALPTGLWAAATALVALIGWGFGRLWRRFPSYAMAVPPFTLSLYYCFVNLERFIPAV